MEFRKYTFKNPDFFYNEESCNSLVVAFDLQTDEYKKMTPEEQKAFYEKRFYEECQLELLSIMMKKLKSVNAYHPDAYPNRDTLLLRVCESLPYEVYPNIMEWVNDEDISVIDYNGLTIKGMLDNMNFPSYEDYKRAIPDITKEKYEEQKARCYLMIFSYMADYAKYNMENPFIFMCEAKNTFRTI